jgi:ubiquitin-like protein ATG12
VIDAIATVVVRFKSIGSAPIMKNNVFKVTAGNKFQAVIVFLWNQLGMKAGDPLVSPGLDPIIAPGC